MSFYGDNVRMFFARVIKGIIQNDEGDDLIQIRIIGLHSEDVPEKDLPFAKCMLPTTEGGTSGLSKIPQIMPGALVFGIFLDGELSQIPMVIGVLNHEGLPSTTQDKQSKKSNPGISLSADKVTEGIFLDSKLESLFDGGKADFEVRMVICMAFLRNAGLPTRSCAAVVGNLAGESTLKENARKEDAIENSYGLAQWNKDVGRFQMLEKFAAKRNRNWDDFFTQLEFLVIDMKKNAAHKVWNHMVDPARTVDFKGGENEANGTWYFIKIYEVADYTPAKLKQREDYAQQAFDLYNNSLRKTAEYKSTTQ